MCCMEHHCVMEDWMCNFHQLLQTLSPTWSSGANNESDGLTTNGILLMHPSGYFEQGATPGSGGRWLSWEASVKPDWRGPQSLPAHPWVCVHWTTMVVCCVAYMICMLHTYVLAWQDLHTGCTYMARLHICGVFGCYHNLHITLCPYKYSVLFILCVHTCGCLPMYIRMHSILTTANTCTVNSPWSAAIFSPEIWWINAFDGLTRYSLVLVRTYVYYVGSGNLWQIKRRINFNSLYVGLCTCGSQNACMYIS